MPRRAGPSLCLRRGGATRAARTDRRQRRHLHPGRESHDRDVALCTAQGRDLSEAMVRAGHAIELARFSRGRYAAAEREAREGRRGLWAGRFDQPADWRREHMR